MKAMRIGILLVFLVPTLCVGMLGCQEPQRELVRREIKPTSKKVSLKKIIGADRSIKGYLQEEHLIWPGTKTPWETFFVRDAHFRRIGFVTSQGATYRYTKTGTAEKLGGFVLENAVKQILKYPGTIYFEDFEPTVITD